MSEIKVRSAIPEDAQRLTEIYTYYVENTAISFEYTAPSVEEFRARMAAIMKKYPYLVIEQDGVIMGYAYANVFKARAAYNRSCEMTIYLDRHAQKCGFGKMLYEALEARLSEMGILNLYACIGYPDTEDEFLNKNSADFHAHMGYSTVGEFHKCGCKFDRWYNMIWMEKFIGEHETPPHPVNFGKESDK